MERRSLLVITAILLAFNTYGQQNVKIAKKEFRTSKPGSESAWSNVENGDKYYESGSSYYKLAISEYNKATLYNSENAELNYKIGVCHLLSDTKDQSLEYFLKAFRLKPEVSTDILLLTGRAYQYNSRFTEALGKYTEYLGSDPGIKSEAMSRVQKYISESNSGMLLVADTASILIINPGDTLNSQSDDYSPVLSSDGSVIYFASRRPTDYRPAGNYGDEMGDENIYFSSIEGSKTNFAMFLDGKLNTQFCESPLFLTPDGQRFYIYGGYSGEGDILVSELKDNEWKTPAPLKPGINSFSEETSVTISPSGSELVFVSSRKGGAGGKDIYMALRENKGWSNPVNLGSVNSPEDEESVAFSVTGDTLWFSSRGHSSIGGFDVFYSSRLADGSWGTPVNAGMPVNSVYDDLYYLPSTTDGSVFYFVTNRPGGLGGLDIYKCKILPPETISVPLGSEIKLRQNL